MLDNEDFRAPSNGEASVYFKAVHKAVQTGPPTHTASPPGPPRPVTSPMPFYYNTRRLKKYNKTTLTLPELSTLASDIRSTSVPSTSCAA
eukprot:scaffold38483_cov67-Phaeocystis_antarctica.AAC.3